MHKVNYEESSDPVRFDPTFSEWGYWDETWTYWTAGYDSEDAARLGLRKYCVQALGWSDK